MMKRRFCRFFCCVWMTGAALGLNGCGTPYVTGTSRNAVEQLLLSGAAERGTDLMDFHAYKDKKVFLDYAYLAPQVDKAMVQGLTERRLAECGAYVVPDPAKADVIVQLSCPVLATDFQKVLIGTPKLPLPLPVWDSYSIMIIIPEIPLFRKLSRYGFAEFSLNILNAADHTPIEVQKNIITRTRCLDWALLLVPWRSHNIRIDESVPNRDEQYEILMM